MAEMSRCGECGAALPAYWPQGLCAQCAIDGALDMSYAQSQVNRTETAVAPADSRSPGMEVNDLLLGTFGDYDLLEEIARGGMGVVYKARQRNLDRLVAVKMILAGPLAGKEFVQRFRTEAAAAAVLQHPNIVAIHDVGVHEGRHYFSMDYVQGRNLAQLVNQQPLPAGKAAQYVQLIAEAVHYAHERGILHRDLKPSNVLIDSVTDQPRVTDFGLAKRLDRDSGLTLSGQVLGSPNFMPPEQAGARRSKMGRSSDIYALGGIIYYLLTARPPFQADSLEQIIAQVLHAEPVAPRLLNPSIPRDLETITLKCLEKEPSRRYPTAQELADELSRVLRHEPIQARPVNVPEKLWRWCRRKPALATAVGLAVAAFLAGLAATSWQWSRAERNAALERQQRERAEAQAYASAMNSTQGAWDANNIHRMPELLLETAASPHRGFEWYFWQRQLHREIKTFRGPQASILALSVSPDGQHLVAGDASGMVWVWDPPTGKLLRLFKGHKDAIRSVAFSPDGLRLVTGSWDGTAKIWNPQGDEEPVRLEGHQEPIFSAAFSPDGRHVVTGSFDRTVRVWDALNGRLVRTLEGHTNRVWAVTFSPDGMRIASGGWDRTVRIWDARTGKNLLAFQGDAEAVLAVAFSPDGKRVITGGWSHSAAIWDAASGARILTLKGHHALIFSVAYTSDGSRIATGGNDQTARIWDAETGDELFMIKEQGTRVSSVAFFPDGRYLVTAGGGVAFSPGSQFVGAYSGAHAVKMWDASESREVRALDGHSNSVWNLAFSSDGGKLASCSFDGTARVWDVAGGQSLWSLPGGHAAPVRAAVLSPDNQRIVTGSFDQMAKVWHLAETREPVLLAGHAKQIYAAAWSLDGGRIATGAWDGAARVWEAATGRALFELKVGSPLYSVAFSRDAQYLLTGDGSGSWRLWHTATPALVKRIRAHKGSVRSATFSPDERRILTTSDDGTARVWDVHTSKPILELRGHTASVMSGTFSPDGKRILTGSLDQTAKLWDASNGKELLSLKHAQSVFTVAYSPEGRLIATGSGDRLIRLWEAASQDQVEDWQNEEQAAARIVRQWRSNLPGAVKSWLVLLPIALERGDGADALRSEQLPGESQLRPRTAERVRVGSNTLVWRALQDEDSVIDFNLLAGGEMERHVAYAVCYLRSETPQEVVLKVDSDDQARIYLNGELLYEFTQARTYSGIGEDTVTGVPLKAGTNVLVFKVVNEMADWRASLRITSTAGQPVQGLPTVLTPP